MSRYGLKSIQKSNVQQKDDLKDELKGEYSKKYDFLPKFPIQRFGILETFPYICIIERHSHSLIHTHSFTHIECFSKVRDIYN